MGGRIRRRGVRRCARVLAGVAPAVMLLTSCHLTPPTIMYAGFRMDGSELVVAMPVCRDETITGAASSSRMRARS